MPNIYDFQKGELKKFDQLNKLVRNVYNQYVMTTAFIFNSTLSLKSINPLFKRSYFTIGEVFSKELHNAVYNHDNVNDAIKDKVKQFYINEEGQLVFLGGKSEKEFIVGIKLDDNTVANMEELMLANAKRSILELKEDTYEYKKEGDINTIQKLIDYEVVTLRCTENKEIALIMTNKLFPNVKKMDNFLVTWFVDDSEIFNIVVQSSYFDGLATFTQYIQGIRC